MKEERLMKMIMKLLIRLLWLEMVITKNLKRILMEHIVSKCSRDSKLFFMSICSIKKTSNSRVIQSFV